MESNLNCIKIPDSVLHGSMTCNDTQLCMDLEKYYMEIMGAIVNADLTLPRKQHGAACNFWSNELSNLKCKSMESHDLWKLAGCPSSGPIFRERCRTHLEYKAAIRLAKKRVRAERTESLYDALTCHDNESFWKFREC